MKKQIMLDCTLRDGGYYTDWKFDNELVQDYLSLCEKACINMVELGYMSVDPHEGSAPLTGYSNVPESLSEDITYPSAINYCVMINGKDLIKYSPAKIADSIASRLQSSSINISTVRIAIKYNNIELISSYINELSRRNICVMINLMQIDLASTDELRECITAINHVDKLGALYLADSLGSIFPDKLKILIEMFLGATKFSIGFHAHNNIGLALHNSIIAAELGVCFIDSTFAGMGRGAGNAKTEQILPALKTDLSAKTLIELYSSISRFFQPLHEKYNWGDHYYYGMSGIKKVHPTYVSNIMSDSSFSPAEKDGLLNTLLNTATGSYDSALYKNTIAELCAYA